MAISLASIARTKHSKPPRMIVHGAEKVGKSTFFSQAPGVVFVQTEDGLTGLDVQAFPLAETMEDVCEAIQALIETDHEYQTVVIDSADWLERLIHDKVCRDHGVKSIELAAGGYGKGYGEALVYWRLILSMLDKLCADKGMFIGMICHSRIVTVSDPETEPYDSYKLKLHEPKSGNQGALSLLTEWADVIGFATRKVFVRKSEVDEKKHRAVSGGDRELRLEGSPAYLAGNRYGLAPSVPLSWEAFSAALSASYSQAA